MRGLWILAASCADEGLRLEPPPPAPAPGVGCENGVRDPDEICLGRTIAWLPDQTVVIWEDRDQNGWHDLLVLEGYYGVWLPADSTLTAYINDRGTLVPHAISFHEQREFSVIDYDGAFGLDFVHVASGGAAQLFVGQPDGTFGEPISIPSMGSDEVSVTAAVDLDGNGRRDLIVCDLFGLRAGIILDHGQGFVLHATIDVPIPHWLYPFEVDGDRTPDLMTGYGAFDGTTHVLWARGLGGGDFDAWQVLYDWAGEQGSLLPYALDGDGDDDFLLLANDEIVPLRTDTASVVRAGPALPLGPWHDVDGDGRDELIVYESALQVRSLPLGEVEQSIDYPFEEASVSGWRWADGRTSAVVIEGSTAYEHPILPDGALGPARTHELDGWVAGPIELDGDDAPDFQRNRWVHRGRLERYVHAYDVDVAPLVDLIDLDGDQTLDLLGGASWSRGAAGGFGSPISIETGGEIVAAGDLDGDGRPDIVASFGDRVAVAVALGGGMFEVEQPSQAVRGHIEHVQLADTARDGSPEVIVLSSTAGIAILTTFALRAESIEVLGVVEAGAWPAISATGDLDGDAKADVVIGREATGEVWIGRDGTFARSDTFEAYGPESLAVGDVDGDGDNDVIAGGNFFGPSFHINDGAGNLTADWEASRLYSHWLPADRELRFLDADGDGNVDLLGVTDRFGTASAAIARDVRHPGRLGPHAFLFRGEDARLAIGDLTGDAVPDAVVVSAGRVQVFAAYP